MNTILIGSFTSPYVRKLRLFLNNLTPFELKPVNYLEKSDSDYLKSLNPINKIPILIDGETVIYDSRIIFQYLSIKYSLKSLTIPEENILSAIDAALDTAINLFSLKRGGLDLEAGNTYIERQKERILLILEFLSPWATTLDPKKPEDWNFLSMSLYSFLYWGQFRGMIDLTNYKMLQKFLIEFQDLPGVAESAPM